MKIFIFIGTFLLASYLFLFSVNTKKVNAQMMPPRGGNVSQENYNQTSEDEKQGQTIYSNVMGGQVNANQLNNDDLEKVGEYFMGRMVGNTQRHVFMNQIITNMMGESGEEAVHINMGRRYINSYSQTVSPNNNGSYMIGGCM